MQPVLYATLSLEEVLVITKLSTSQLVELLKQEAFPSSWSGSFADQDLAWLKVEVLEWLKEHRPELDNQQRTYIDIDSSTADTLVIHTAHRNIEITLADLMHLLSSTKAPSGESFLKRIAYGRSRASLGAPYIMRAGEI